MPRRPTLRSPRQRRVATGLYAGWLFAVLGLISWVTGQPFVFPSLGPSAFVLAFRRRVERTRRTVVGSHAVGAAAGYLAYSLLAFDVTLVTTAAPLSPAGFRLAASGVLSIVLTTWGMLVTDTVHAPACATTLIVSLGLLATPVQVAVVVVSVVVLVEAHAVVRFFTSRFIDEIHPVQRED